MWKYLKNAHGGTDAFGSLTGVEGSSERSEPRGATAAVGNQAPLSAQSKRSTMPQDYSSPTSEALKCESR